jgi:hypothetical protein
MKYLWADKSQDNYINDIRIDVFSDYWIINSFDGVSTNTLLSEEENIFWSTTYAHYITTYKNTKNWTKTTNRWVFYIINFEQTLLDQQLILQTDKKDDIWYFIVRVLSIPLILSWIFFYGEYEWSNFLDYIDPILSKHWLNTAITLICIIALVTVLWWYILKSHIEHWIISFENTDFEKHFDVQANNPLQARVFLNPSRLEVIHTFVSSIQYKKWCAMIFYPQRLIIYTSDLYRWWPSFLGKNPSYVPDDIIAVNQLVEELEIHSYKKVHNDNNV